MNHQIDPRAIDYLIKSLERDTFRNTVITSKKLVGITIQGNLQKPILDT